MLIVVMNVKTMTQSLPSVNTLHGTKTGQSTWQCGLYAQFIDSEQMSVQQLIALKRIPHTTHDGH